MSVTSCNLTDLAAELIQHPTEVAWRAAASRAYYASFHFARNAAEQLPNNAHFALQGGTHKYLIDRFETYRGPASTEGKQARKIAYILKDLKKRREKADYDIGEKIPKTSFETTVAQSNVANIEIAKLVMLLQDEKAA